MKQLIYGDYVQKFSNEALERFPGLKHAVVAANADQPEILLYVLNRIRIELSNRKQTGGENRKKTPRKRVGYLSIVR